MQCLAQLTPPTAVTHAVSLPFLSSSANNLVIAKTSLLQIFSLKSIITEAVDAPTEASTIKNGTQARTPRSKGLRRERVQTTKLVLVAQYDLPGTITALGRVKLLHSKSGGEAVLVALKDAKLSLIEWDSERYCISTISVHYYEREDIQASPWVPALSQCVSYLMIDPSSRCAALKFGARHIAILPFHQAGDDLVMDDYDTVTIPDQIKKGKSNLKLTNGDLHAPTPYKSSFVLSLLALDPSLMHVVHLAFLYEYREPTFGVLSSRVAVSSGLLHDRKDILCYTVYTLDLEQRASTTLLSITDLPYDLHTISPLPLPIGGALLIGCNELIHVDQAGKTNGIAVNEFGLENTSFKLPSQSELGIRLEGCAVEQFGSPNGDILIILNSGQLAVLHFRVDGRSVSGLLVRIVSEESGGKVLLAGASCTASVGRGRLFIGSEEADSTVLGWGSRLTKLKKQRSSVQFDAVAEATFSDLENDDDDDDMEDEDDLYYVDKTNEEKLPMPVASSAEQNMEEYIFQIHDSLANFAPLSDLTLVNAKTASIGDSPVAPDLVPRYELIASTRLGRASTLTKLKPAISPQVSSRHDLANVHGVWSMAAKIPSSNSDDPTMNAGYSDEYDSLIITSIVDDNGEGQSHAYAVSGGDFTELSESDFDSSAGATVAVGALDGGKRIVQVLKNEIRTYDDDLSLAQIYPMSEDPTHDDPKVVGASFAEPYLLLLRDDSTIVILKADDAGELEEVESQSMLAGGKWVSGSLFDDSNDVFRLESNEEDMDDEGGSILLFLLNIDGGLLIFKVSNLRRPVYTAPGLSFLPPFLAEDFTIRRSTARDVLVEILVTELGDDVSKAPYLLLRSFNQEIIIYQPFQSITSGISTSQLRFLKISTPKVSKVISDEASDNYAWPKQRLQAVNAIDGYSAVTVSGVSPVLILKSASSLPQTVAIDLEDVRSFGGFHGSDCKRGLIYVDNKGVVVTASLPRNADYSTGWVNESLFCGENIGAFMYHAKTNLFVLGVSREATFKLAEDELHPEWANEEASLLPTIEQSSIDLFSSISRAVVDSYALDPTEIVLCMQIISLEVSEHTHARRPLIVVGTALIGGEDTATKGRIYVLDIIPVVPEPSSTETTSYKLKLITKEEVKGAVTAISGIGSEGFMLVAQGQKCMVRGLKEDGTCLPVAFLDMQCYISVAKELPGTGLCVLGDAAKGVWLVGYTEDPYHLRLFGKSAEHVEVIAAELLPDGKELYIVAIDADGVMRILQFDPHNPKSLQGQRLLHLSSLNTGAYPTKATLLPSVSVGLSPSSDSMEIDPSSYSTAMSSRMLLASRTGSLSLISSLTPSAYRTLAAIQTHLINTLSHPLGLNPRAYRAAEADNLVGGRAVLDGDVLKRWGELGSWKKADGLSRAGVEEWDLRGLLRGVVEVGL